jgi:hypothetical protein
MSKSTFNVFDRTRRSKVSTTMEMIKAADLHAEANKSDPFARDRIMLEMQTGRELPSDVEAEAGSAIRLRKQAISAAHEEWKAKYAA